MAEEEFREITGAEMPEFGEFYKWEHIGEQVTGIYERKRINEERNVGDRRFKEQNLYDIRGAAGDLWTLNGNFDLDSKMKKVRQGSKVRITYVEDKDIGTAGMSAMRVFKVEVANTK